MNKNEGIWISGHGQINAANVASGPKARAVTYAHHPDTEQSTRGPGHSREGLDRTVFVIHGRDSQARLRMFDLLRRMGLHPLEWESIVQEVGMASPYLGDTVRAAFTIAQAALVLMTPDDIVRLHPSLQGSGPDPEHGTQCQARPNVLFEAGMAFGLYPERTVLIKMGHLRDFSDIGGRNYIQFDGSVPSILKLRQRLQTAGCAVRATGEDFADTEHLQNLDAYTRHAAR